MSNILLTFKPYEINIPVSLDEKVQKAIERFLAKNPELDPKTLRYLVNANPINPDATVESLMINIEGQKLIPTIVVDINKDPKKGEEKTIQSKEIICPKCGESTRIKIENGRIKLFDCVNSHNNTEIEITNFQDTQKIDISKIICEDCKQSSMATSYNNLFYKCFTCGNKICIICQRYKHDKTHDIVEYEKKL